MECFLSFLILLAVVVVMAALAARAQSHSDRRNRAFQHLAERFSGVCLPGGWFGGPTVRLQYGATQAIISTGIVRGPVRSAFTQIQIQWPSAEHHLEVQSRGAESARPPARFGQELTTGCEAFDEEFSIASTQPQAARRLLSEGVQWQIGQIGHAAEGAPLQLTISRARLLVRVFALLRRFEELEQFTQLALGLYDQAMLTQTVGIEFVGEAVPPQTQTLPRCQICGEQIEEHPVLCRRCKTPHHLDCWQYYGACSTYGCKESRYILPPASTGDQTGRTGSEGR